MTRCRKLMFLLAAATLTAACGSADSGAEGVPPFEGSEATRATASASLPASIENQGGSLEGHTPRGFAGMGTGLFVGDNLNPGFPNDDGVQTWLTVDWSAT